MAKNVKRVTIFARDCRCVAVSARDQCILNIWCIPTNRLLVDRMPLCLVQVYVMTHAWQKIMASLIAKPGLLKCSQLFSFRNF